MGGDHVPRQALQKKAGSTCWVKFIACNRRRRGSRHSVQAEKISRFQVSANTRPRCEAKEISRAFSKVASRGGEKSPVSINRSRAPLPPRVGIRVTTVAPLSNAN